MIIGKTVKNGKTTGTVASFDKTLIKNPLDECELNCLNTKSAITYKDSDLKQTSNEILRKREIEIQESNLETLSKIKKKYRE